MFHVKHPCANDDQASYETVVIGCSVHHVSRETSLPLMTPRQ